MKNTIYNFQRKYTRWGALCPGTFLPVLMIGGKCSCLRAKAAPISGHLPRKMYEKRGCALGEMLPCSGNVYDTNCPTRHVLNVIVDKWAALIVGLLGRQTMRFTELHRQIGGISQKMLTQTLRHLERDGLVQRTVYAEVPPRVEYALTPLGRSLRELIAPIREWSNVNVKDIIAAQQQYDTQALNEK